MRSQRHIKRGVLFCLACMYPRCPWRPLPPPLTNNTATLMVDLPTVLYRPQRHLLQLLPPTPKKRPLYILAFGGHFGLSPGGQGRWVHTGVKRRRSRDACTFVTHGSTVQFVPRENCPHDVPHFIPALGPFSGRAIFYGSIAFLYATPAV